PWVYRALPNKIMQGVTTEITGNCGFSAAPIVGGHSERFAGVWAREGVEVPDRVPWRTFEEYRGRMEENGLVTNFVPLVGHGNLRSAVMGFSPRPATQSEIEEMKALLRQAMQEGAYGISFGLVYLPGLFSETGELVELCREAARNIGICAFHIRGEGAGLVEAVREALEVGEKAQAAIQISHLKASGKKNWDKIEEAFRLIEDARYQGVRVAADAYPYTAGFAELGVILPDDLYQREDRVAYFQDLFKRTQLLDELRDHDDIANVQWDSVMIAATRHERYWRYEGMTFKQIARKTGKEPERFLIEILADTSFEVSAFYFSQSEKVVDQVLSKHYVAVGSDSIADGSRKP
ncbi:MAG: hypothetical protein L0Z48_12105, partial [candidate division Zixibacteria bacterium]|nr:hypothetical protein [candidate division Zixibacteria bacterium]